MTHIILFPMDARERGEQGIYLSILPLLSFSAAAVRVLDV
jgi:hypothetical protein